ncbi:peptidase M15 [Fischerella thermalis WC542]|uniref:D-alanyl-D-alanine carboxypeptidase family protein n=1 Tax=Fischerella thermalis TaxID=372787 RepID=UPI000C80DDF2|nr:D-alanyl-D-alanine carboxypeptidase family protein [Fischerella thermalis]PLZ26514.1 peptidase M15 [Fischerella thermalis WC559]PLZ29358.1 peptidase M15 [Fischerella thermalis WC558]PLZ33736.1 peptidase M15 [Fischerella thermalis WC542]PLZ57479.1 peptidase M15 [Fischerella thermalis WC442]PLZ58266.1 peptidase M15 [Fischerella thermalis WC439]
MKRFWKKTAFYTIVALIVFSLAASSGTTNKILSQDIRYSESYILDGSLHKQQSNQLFIGKVNEIVIPTPETTPNPNLNLNNKERFLAAITDKLSTIPQSGTYEYILLRAYGAAFVNHNPEVQLPSKVLFKDDKETKEFQAILTMAKVNGTNNCYLQKAATDALNRAKAQVSIALKSGYADSDCTRSFATNVRFWRKYANDKTLARVQKGQETKILGTVAPPGASQHLWGLAIDLRVSSEAQIQALNQNGWFRTVEYDAPHWTYIGYPLDKLSDLGFQNKVIGGISYWLNPL